ncbi:uncharacterized protein LOC115014845 [Cottoperca gobio]|uniref:Uncharacterized protein LOC115014845 n=1 Tax=Cottoperca gobio TaxID=56716 RepID=A0A6J2QK35_COTGO|nr:uncharacterized protein LOC115014845 [Cottoperca gobio]
MTRAFLAIFEGTAATCGSRRRSGRCFPCCRGKPIEPHTSCQRHPDIAMSSSGGRFWPGWAAHPRDTAAGSRACPLRTLAARSLQPGTNSAEDVIGQVALEQFIAGLLTSSANWVQCHRPATLVVLPSTAEPGGQSLGGKAWGAKSGPLLRHRSGPCPMPHSVGPAFTSGAAGAQHHERNQLQLTYQDNSKVHLQSTPLPPLSTK